MNQKDVIAAYKLIKAARGVDKLIANIEGRKKPALNILALEEGEDGDTIGETEAGVPVDILLLIFRDAAALIRDRLASLHVELEAE